MKNFLELVKTRRSVRGYLSREVERDKIDYILECARMAPSAVNFQPWRFYIAASAASREALCGCYDRDWFRTAPVVIAVCVDERVSWKRAYDGRDHADVDAAIAAEHICLAAAEQGLGSCWVCNFDPEKCATALGLEPQVRPVALIPIGYAAEDSVSLRPRKERAEIAVKI